MDFVKHFIEQNKEAESPTSFWKWAGYACVGATLRDNVWFDQGIMKTYPNIYVVLLADSAEHRKSVPLNRVSHMIRDVRNTKIIQGRASIQQVIEDLAASEMDRKTGLIVKGGSCILCAGELAAFFVDDPQSIRILTDLYDFRPEYEVSLKSGKCKVTNVCLSMLAASNETLLRDVYTDKAVYGGLLGRTFFVKPDEFRQANSLMRVDLGKYDLSPLVTKLREISKLKGQMIGTDDAIDEYDRWYMSLRNTYKGKKDRTGVLGRMHTGVLKISMIIAASEHRELEIKKCCIEQAIEDCSSLLANYEEYATSMGKSSAAQIGSTLLTMLWVADKHEISRKKVLQDHWTDFTAKDLDEVVSTLEQAEMIQTVLSNDSCTYRMTGKCERIFTSTQGTETIQ